MSDSSQRRLAGSASAANLIDELTQWWLELPAEDRRSAGHDAYGRADVAALLSLTQAYLQQRGSDAARSQHTLRAYRRTIQLLLRHLAGQEAERIDAKVVQSFLENLAASGVSQSTLKVHVAALRGLCGALHWAGVLDADPCLGLRVPQGRTAPRRQRESYSEEEQAGLLALAEPPDAALIRLLQAGLTVSEAVSLRWSDVDLRRGAVHVWSGTRERDVRLSPASAEAIRALGHRGRGPLLGFATDVRARQRVERLASGAEIRYRGLRGFSPRRGSTSAHASGVDLSAQVTACLEAFNRREYRRLARCFASDVTISEPATGSSIHGIASVVAVLRQLVDAFPDARGEVINSFTTGQMAFAQIMWTGTHKGNLASEHGVIAASGRHLAVPAYLVVSLERALVTRVHAYVDRLEELSQLGVLDILSEEEGS